MVELTVPVKVDDDEKKEPMPEPSPAPVLEQELETPTQSKTPSVNPFDLIPSISESAERVAKDIKNLVPEIDPDKYAEAQRTADRLPGSNADDVYEDLKPYKQAEQKNAFDRIVDKNPATARFFNKEKNVKIAGDSAEELSAFESLYTYGGRSVARGGIRIGQMYQQYIGEQSAEQASDSKRTFMDILRTESPQVATSTVGVYNPVDVLFAAERFATSRIFSSKDASDAASYRLGKVQDLLTLSETEYGMAQKDHLEAIVKAGKDSPLPAIEVALRSPGKSLALALEIAGEFAPQLALSGITTAIAGPAAGSAMLGVQSGLVERFVSPAEYFGKRGYDLGKPEDIRKIINDPDIMSEAQRYGLDRAVIIGAMDAISGGVASQYYGSVLRTFLVNTVAQPALGGGGEALAQLKTQGKVENWGEVVLEAMAEFATMPVEVSMLGGRAIRDARNARTAKSKVELSRQANELAKNSKLAERSKDVAEEHRADVLRENSVDKVTIDAEKFTQYMQDEGDPDFAASLGLTEEGLQEALELGAEIRLDADGYAHLIGRESYDKIADDVRFDEGGMTGAEAKNYEENYITEEITKFNEEFESFDVDKQVAINTIRQEVEAQVRASGRSDNEAQFLGIFLGEKYATRSERSGMSPLEMWRRDNVRMVGPSEQMPGFDAIDLAIDRFRGGVPADQFLKLAKTPMIDTLVRQGGVDPAGRFAGELAARGITPKTNPRLFKKDGIKDADTLIQEELGFLDAEPATETGYVNPDLVVDAVEAEVGGTPYRSLAEQGQIVEYEGGTTEISRIMDAAGLTAESSPQEIRAAVDAAVGDARQFEQTDTGSEAFKNWFGDSKVVDENGEPLVVYHGTNFDFDAFDPKELGKTFKTPTVEKEGFFFANNPATAGAYAGPQPMSVIAAFMSKDYADSGRGRVKNAAEYLIEKESMQPNIMPVFLSIQNPLVIDLSKTKRDDIDLDLIAGQLRNAKSQGYDGAILKSMSSPTSDGIGLISAELEPADVFVAFEPTQIKSQFNRGTFDTSDVNILHQTITDGTGKPLAVVHNISEEKLRHAVKMGGLPVPSLAIIDAKQEFTNFGNIQLVAAPSMVDPRASRRNRVFDADVYSPRYPTGDIERTVDRDAADAAQVELDALAEEIGEGAYRPGWLQETLSDTGTKFLKGERPIQQAFLRSIGVQQSVGLTEQAIEGREGEFDQFVEDTYGSLITKERILDKITDFGRKYLPHNLDSVVRIMKRDLRGGERFSYGVGNIRAQTAKEFRSLRDIKDARDRIVTEADMKAFKDDTDDAFGELAQELTAFYSGDPNSFGYLSTVVEMISDFARRGESAVEDNGFANVSDEAKQKIVNFLANLRQAPTEYFEAKIQRAVSIDEFQGAIVEPETPQDIRDLLEGAGLRVVEAFGKKSEALQEFFPRVLFQSTGLRAGTEDLTAYGIEPDKRYKVRDIALALEARQRDKFGTVERNDRSDAASDKLSNWMANEVEFEYQNNPEESGVGWYSEKYQAALDKLGQFFPEFVSEADFNPDNLPGITVLENTKNSRDFFTALLAITSDGQRVADNFRIAQEIYSEFRETGKLPVGDTKGARRVASVAQNIENLQTALDKYGPAKMHERLLRQLTVGEMNAELRAEGKAVIGGYTVDMVMPYSALIFGSKLGAFYANLMGASGYLTMDLWYTRTFNRYRGNMLPPVSGLNNALDKNGKPMGLARFKSLYVKDKKINKPWQEITDDEALAHLGEYQAIAKAKGFKNTTAIEKAANTLHKAAFTALQEQPYNPSDRKFMVTAVQKAQDKLRERGIDATIADIQAILWYYEKRLYGELTGAKPSDISYAEAVESLIRDTGREAGQGAESIVIEGPDGNLFEVVGQRGLESDFSDPSYLAREFQQPSRGSIELRAHETVIRLGKKADASTFLHENGHLFLEQLKSDAKEFGTKQLVDDWNITRNWWGSNSESIRSEAIRYAKKKGDSESAAALDKMSEGDVRAYVRSGDLTGGKEYKGKGGSTTAMQYLTEAMHEQYARGFEDYLRTGQAPSVQLQGAFNRFRAWLVSIYTAIQRRLGRDILDVQYSPEVAGVMDRLLASDTDIELVREQYNLKALYDSAEEAGMTPKQFEVYQLQVARAVDQSKTRQLKKHLNEAEREQEDFWEAEGEQIAVGIRSELAQEPVYKALWTLTQKTLADGSLLPANFSIDRLNRKAVIEVLQSAKSLARLPKVKGKAIYATRTKESSVHPDVAAQMFGFQNSMEMLQQMAAARPFEEVVQERVDAQLKEKYGDMRNDGSAVEAAIDSVHIDETAEVLTAELNALRDSKDKMKPAFVRNWAQEKIGTRKVSELRPGEFLQAERRHAKEAGKLLRQGDRLGAQRAKFKQLMNFYMAKEAIKAREEIAKGRKYFSKFTKKRKNYKTLAADYVDQIKNILSNYQFGPRLSKDIKSWLDFAKMAEETDSAIFNIPQEIIDADGQTNYQDLTLDEFRTLRDAITSIEKQGREAKTVTVEGERLFIADAITEIMSGFETRPVTKRAVGNRRGYPSTIKGKWSEWKDKRVSNLVSIDAALAKVEFLAFQVDGERMGPFHKFFFQVFADSEVARNELVADVSKPIMDAFENMPRERRSLLGEKIYIPELDWYGRRSEFIMMALNTGNTSNRKKMIEGSVKDVYDSGALTEVVLDKILDNLSLEDWQLVQTVWDSFQKMYPQVEAVFRKENGRAPEKIEAVPFEREFNGKTYKFSGGYFPMIYSSKRSTKGMNIEQKTALEAMQTQMNQESVFSGMTKERAEGFSAPVDLDITAIHHKLEQTAHYITHYEAVRTTRKLLGQERLNKAIVQTMGAEYYQVLENWMGAVAANQAPQLRNETFGNVIKIFRSNATVAIMGFSFTTGLAQSLGLFTSADALAQGPGGKYNILIGSKWLIAGMFQYISNPAQSIRMIKELSGEMRYRILNTDRDASFALRRFAKTTQGQGMMMGGYKAFQRFSLMVIAGAQVLMVDYPTWLGAYNKGLAEGKAPGDAVNYADSIIRTSQTAGGIKDLSAVQMNEVMAPMLMFYSFFNVLYNIERQIVGDVKGISDVPQMAARVFIVMALPTIIENLYKDKWPDEDEDEDGKISGWDYAKWTTMKTVYFGASSVPLLRDVVGGAAVGFGYSLSPMDSLGDSLVRFTQQLSKAFDEDDPEMTAAQLKTVIEIVGFGAGLPVIQLNRAVKTGFKMEEGEDVDWYDWLIGYRDPDKSAFKN